MDLFNISQKRCKMTAAISPMHMWWPDDKNITFWLYHFHCIDRFELFRSHDLKIKTWTLAACPFDHMSQIFDFRPYFLVKAFGGTRGRIQGIRCEHLSITFSYLTSPEYVLMSHQALLLKSKGENRKSGSCGRKSIQWSVQILILRPCSREQFKAIDTVKMMYLSKSNMFVRWRDIFVMRPSRVHRADRCLPSFCTICDSYWINPPKVTAVLKSINFEKSRDKNLKSYCLVHVCTRRMACLRQLTGYQNHSTLAN